jgi:hypothetical protein
MALAGSAAEFVSPPLPSDIQDLIQRRAGPAVAGLVRSFAQLAISNDGVELRVQKSKNEPSYFQVRSDRANHVVAYVNPGPSDVRIDFRLPRDQDLYGRARLRTNAQDAYAIQLYMSEPADLEIAQRLLTDALAVDGSSGGE